MIAPPPQSVARELYLSCRRYQRVTYFNLFSGVITCTTNLTERVPSQVLPHTNCEVDLETRVKGLGPGVNKVISTGSRVMVGRCVGGRVGKSVLVGGVSPAARVDVASWVLVANRSGVSVYPSDIRVTLGCGECTTSGAGV